MANGTIESSYKAGDVAIVGEVTARIDSNGDLVQEILVPQCSAPVSIVKMMADRAAMVKAHEEQLAMLDAAIARYQQCTALAVKGEPPLMKIIPQAAAGKVIPEREIEP